MDTTHIAYTAEDYIAHVLQKHGFLVAKPKFDQHGTDLMAFLTVEKGAKFGRIQCKGRRLLKSSRTNIKIPKSYVVGAFFVFLYLEQKKKNFLYVFFPKDIKKWKLNNNDEYVLSINGQSLDRHIFDDQNSVALIRDIIQKTPTESEMKMWGIIEKQQQLNKLTALSNKIKSLKQNIAYINETKRLLDENINLYEEKASKMRKKVKN